MGGKKRSEGEREGRGGECGKEEMVVKRANVKRGKSDGHTERGRKNGPVGKEEKGSECRVRSGRVRGVGREPIVATT